MENHLYIDILMVRSLWEMNWDDIKTSFSEDCMQTVGNSADFTLGISMVHCWFLYTHEVLQQYIESCMILQTLINICRKIFL